MKIGLLLAGGSLKGIYAHSGVVIAMRELGLFPSAILGASAGSVVASFHAIGMSSEEMENRLINLQAKDFLDPFSRIEFMKKLILERGKNFVGFVRGDKLEDYIQKALKAKDNFSSTNIPLYIPATDLRTYKKVLFNSGSISEKVRASTAIPMMFCPKKIEGSYYVDGALAPDKLPKMFSEVCPDLDVMIVSFVNYQPSTDDNTFIESSGFPIIEIMRRTLELNKLHQWPIEIGKTKIVILQPSPHTPVDIFKPARDTAISVFDDSYKYARFHLKNLFKEYLADNDKPIG